MTQLSQKQKIQIAEQLTERDGGYRCFYCKTPCSMKRRPIIEHLNDKRSDNRLDNLVLSCQSCNIKKAADEDCVYSDIAFLKREQNENQIYVREKILNRLTKSTKKEIPTEIDINTNNYKVVLDFIESRVESFDSVEYKDALNSCVYLCKSKTSHGSQQCVRNYIQAMTSSVSPYEIIKRDNKKIIVKRAR